MSRSSESREEFIEYDILEYLSKKIPLVYHNDIKGYFDQNRGFYRKNKNGYIRQGISDITGLLPEGRYLAIEVKKPSEMAFFDRPIEELTRRYAEAFARNVGTSTIKKYEHAILQRQFLDDVISAGGVAFFASSVKEVEQKLKGNGYLHPMV